MLSFLTDNVNQRLLQRNSAAFPCKCYTKLSSLILMHKRFLLFLFLSKLWEFFPSGTSQSTWDISSSQATVLLFPSHFSRKRPKTRSIAQPFHRGFPLRLLLTLFWLMHAQPTEKLSLINDNQMTSQTPHLFILLHHFQQELWIWYRVIFRQCYVIDFEQIFSPV